MHEEFETSDQEAFVRIAIPLLIRIATRRYHVPHDAAEDLVQDVLLSYFAAAGRVRHPRRFLVGAVVYASRDYWRRSRRVLIPLDAMPELQLPDTTHARELLLRDIVQRLRRAQRDVMLMRIEGWSIRDIAIRLGISSSAADKRLRVALRQARIIAATGTPDDTGDLEPQPQPRHAELRLVQTPVAVSWRAYESLLPLRRCA